MSDSWDDYADEWDTDVDAITYSEKAYESLLNEVNIENTNVLDFGCGTGLLTERLATLAKSIVAIDTSPKMIAILKLKNIRNVIPLSEKLTFELVNSSSLFSKKFDIIVASSVFSFLPNYESILNILKSLLIPGGILIQWDWLSSNNDTHFGLSEFIINEALNDTGFKEIILTKPFSITTDNVIRQVVMGVAKNN